MHGIRWARAAGVIGAVLVAAACGSGGEPDDAGEPEDGTEEVTTVGLEEAFASAAEATSYTIEQSTGQKISSQMLGNSTSEIDEANPSIVGEVSPDATHLAIDLSTILGPILGDAAADVGFEIWTDPERMVLDTRDYAAVQEQNPDADLGPFAPGVSYVDLAALSGEAPDLLQAVVGQGSVDLAQLADELPDVLDDVEQDGATFTGTASYAEILGTLGSDVDQIARSAAGGLALNLDVDPEILTDFYKEFYESVEADVTVEIGDDDLVESMRYEVDLSNIFSSMIEDGDPLGLDIPADQLDEARTAFDETVWILESLIKFEVVDDLTVEPAPDTTDDRTDAWVAFLEASGF